MTPWHQHLVYHQASSFDQTVDSLYHICCMSWIVVRILVTLVTILNGNQEIIQHIEKNLKQFYNNIITNNVRRPTIPGIEW